jgi:hypothetical protein
MSHTEEDKLLSKLYRQSSQEQPPATLDELILQHASQSHHRDKPGRSWRPWLAAASVVLVVPLIWLLTQDTALLESGKPPTTLSLPAAEPATGEPTDDAEAADSSAAPAPVVAAPVMEAQTAEPAAPPADAAMMEEEVAEPARIQVTGSRVRSESLALNKQLLIEQATGGKRPLKPDSMGPELALLYQQFNRYLNEGQLDFAEAVLNDMQQSHPEFDYVDLLNRLEQARGQQQD